MAIKVTVTRTLEDWWGAEDMLADCGDDKALFDKAIIELINEDILEFLNGATWFIEIENEQA